MKDRKGSFQWREQSAEADRISKPVQGNFGEKINAA